SRTLKNKEFGDFGKNVIPKLQPKTQKKFRWVSSGRSPGKIDLTQIVVKRGVTGSERRPPDIRNPVDGSDFPEDGIPDRRVRHNDRQSVLRLIIPAERKTCDIDLRPRKNAAHGRKHSGAVDIEIEDEISPGLKFEMEVVHPHDPRIVLSEDRPDE